MQHQQSNFISICTKQKIHCQTFEHKFKKITEFKTSEQNAFLDIGNELKKMLDNENVKFIIIEKE